MTHDEQELNRKIARWLEMGNYAIDIESGDIYAKLTAKTFDGQETQIARWQSKAFTESMDICEEYVVPTLDGFQLQLVTQKGRRFWQAWVFSKGYIRLRGEADTAPMALCRAVEQLIDGESK